MAVQTQQTDDATRIHVSGALTIAEAMETRDQLALAFATASKVELDLSEIIEIDCAGLQLLLTLPKEPIPVTFTQISDPLRELLQHLKLMSKLGLEH